MYNFLIYSKGISVDSDLQHLFLQSVDTTEKIDVLFWSSNLSKVVNANFHQLFGRCVLKMWLPLMSTAFASYAYFVTSAYPSSHALWAI